MLRDGQTPVASLCSSDQRGDVQSGHAAERGDGRPDGPASCEFWVAGGWGVDALAVDAEHETAALAASSLLGCAVETDWRPVRVELVAPNRAWVDLHPVTFDRTGHGRQADLAGGHFDYPPEAFTNGTLGGAVVPCLSREQQVRFHRGYEPRPTDLHDLRLLERLPYSP